MATVTSVTKHFATAKEGFTTTLASTISSGAATVPLNSVTGYSNGEVVALVIEPTDASKKQVFTGTIDTSGVQVTGVVWTEGTNQAHNAGVTVVDYWTATHQAMMVKGVKVSIDDDGTLKAGAVDNTAVLADSIVTKAKLASAVQTELNDGWTTPTQTVSSVTNNGNRSYDVVFNSTVASVLSPGMRLRTTRTVTAPTQCADLESGSSQYFSKATPNKLTFTDDFTCMGWVKMESFANMDVIARWNGTTQGWRFTINPSGQVIILGYTTGGGSNRGGRTHQSIPIGKWVHIAGSLDMSGNSAIIYIDGVSVPVEQSYTGGTSTALIQAGDLNVGAGAGAAFFDGKLAQVAVFSSVLSASTIRSYMNQGLSGSESNLVSAYSCSNSLLDLNTATPNDLTANGGALMTNADSPFGQDSNGVTAGTTDYALVMKVSTTTATVQVPEGCTIPTSGGVSAVAYSTATSPFGFTTDKGRWAVETMMKTQTSKTGTPTVMTWYNLCGANLTGGFYLTIPVGAWAASYQVNIQGNGSAAFLSTTLSDANNTEIDSKWSTYVESSGTVTSFTSQVYREGYLNLGTATAYYLNSRVYTGGNPTVIYNRGEIAASVVKAIPAGI